MAKEQNQPLQAASELKHSTFCSKEKSRSTSSALRCWKPKIIPEKDTYVELPKQHLKEKHETCGSQGTINLTNQYLGSIHGLFPQPI